jgi:hypothetical protein
MRWKHQGRHSWSCHSVVACLGKYIRAVQDHNPTLHHCSLHHVAKRLHERLSCRGEHPALESILAELQEHVRDPGEWADDQDSAASTDDL